VAGAGPAGCAAALEALREGLQVSLFDQAAFPRHKVCGEFLSPEIEPVLRRLGVWERFLQARPARIRRAALHFGRRAKRWTLDSPAWGLSRFALDDLLLQEAIRRGARFRREALSPDHAADGPLVIAYGRKSAAPKGRRLFGFKAHFRGPVDDSVSLFFFNRCYAGISAVEDGRVNICGLAPEPMLRAAGFDPGRVMETCPRLAARVREMQPLMEWLITGPLVFSESLRQAERPGIYHAGDALGFIDPFTGSGIASALLTGAIAARSAARGLNPTQHARRCRAALGRQYWFAGLVRNAIEQGWAEWLLPAAPGNWLFAWTRPTLQGLEELSGDTGEPVGTRRSAPTGGSAQA
jgi:2-polyprenyl-6-methoxyphenol hydroxylase-like FAD-dependent oxidoreductase